MAKNTPKKMRVVLVESVFDEIEGDPSDPDSTGQITLFIPAGTSGTVTSVSKNGIAVTWDAAMFGEDLLDGWEWPVEPKLLRVR